MGSEDFLPALQECNTTRTTGVHELEFATKIAGVQALNPRIVFIYWVTINQIWIVMVIGLRDQPEAQEWTTKLVDGGAGVTVEAEVPSVTGQAIEWAGHGWWTGSVVDYMLEGTHDKPFGVWIGDNVQPVRRAGVSLCFSGGHYPVLAMHRKTAGVCWKITYVIHDWGGTSVRPCWWALCATIYY